MANTLRKVQIDALEAMKEHDGGVLEIFCGSGKTRIMVEHTLRNEPCYVVFVFPSLALMSQFKECYIGRFDNYKHLMISSQVDDTTDKQDWKEIEHDIFGEYGHAKNMNVVFFIKE